MIGSLGFSTISLMEIGGAHLRFWEVFLVLILLNSFRKFHFLAVSRLSLFMSSLVLLFALLSGLNVVNLYLYIKQVLLLSGMLLLFLVAANRDSEIQLTSNLRCIVYPGFLLALWGVLEVLFFPQNLQIYSSNFGLWHRAASFFAEANEFSQYLTVPFGFGLSMLFIYSPLSRSERCLLILGLCAVVIAQIVTFSRGGILSFFGELMVFLYLRFTDKRTKLPGSSILIKFTFIIAILVAVIFFSDILIVMIERMASLLSISDPTTIKRLDTIRLALQASTSSFTFFLLGIGFGNLPEVLGFGIANSGNILVDIFSEVGFLGFLVFLGFIALCFILPSQYRNSYENVGNSKILAVFYGANISFAGLILGGLTSPTHMLNIFWLTSGLLVGIYHYGKYCNMAEKSRY
jgi:hypothetical protein